MLKYIYTISLAVFSCLGLSAQNYNLDCSTFKQHGTHRQGFTINNYQWLSIEANFLSTGQYSISTDTMNGVYYLFEGNVLSTGVQEINLLGYGLPVDQGNHVYEISGECSLNIYTQNQSCTFRMSGASYGKINCVNDSSGAILLDVNYASGTAPFDYSWSSGLPNSASVFNLTSELFQVTVYDADSCNFSYEVVPTSAPGTTVQTDTLLQICLGDSITLNATSETDIYTLKWYDNASLNGAPLASGHSQLDLPVSPLQTTSYYLVESWNCTSEPIEVVVEVLELSEAPLADTLTICIGDSVELLASCSGQVQWYSSPNTTGTVLHSGSSFNVSPQDTTAYYAYCSNGVCLSESYSTFIVNVKELAEIPFAQEFYETCEGGEIELDASTILGSGLITWHQTNDPNSTPIANGILTVTAQDYNTYYAFSETGAACTGLAGLEAVVSGTTLDGNISGPNTYTVCEGGSVELALNATTDVIWYNSADNSTPIGSGTSITVSPTETSSYFAIATDGNCMAADLAYVVNVDVNPSPEIPSGQSDYSGCIDENILLTATGSPSGTLLWFTNPDATGVPVFNGDQFPVIVNGNQSYYVFEEITEGCLNPAPLVVNVNQNQGVQISMDTIKDIICHDETLTLTVNTIGSSVVEWFTTPERTPESLVFVGNPYVINPQPQTSNPIETIEYYGYASDGTTGCYSENFTYVNITLLSELDVPVGQTEYYICEGESITMNAQSTTVGQICWFDTDPPIGSPLMIAENYTVSPSVSTTYYAFDEYSIGCLSGSLPVTVFVEDCSAPIIDNGTNTSATRMVTITPSVYVFSPNNDGMEDELQIGSPEMTNYYVEIFNMSGQLVKVIEHYNDGWDGRDMNGATQPNGYYIYVLEADGVKERRLIGISK